MAKLFITSASRSDVKFGLSIRQITAWGRRRVVFLLMVVLPTLLAIIYYGLIASPQYVSQADFIVRGQTPQTPGLLAGILSSGGATGGSEDTYAVQDYVMSRDAAQLLLKTQDLSHVFNIPEADVLARFPNFYSGGTFEHFYRYYKRHVKAELDTTTGLSTLSVRTFEAATSQRIARALLTAAEQLVNEMNERQRENTIAASLRERDKAISRLQTLNIRIDAYRNQTGLLDPQRQSQPLLTDLAGLDTARMTTRVQLEQLRRSTPNSPLIEVLTRRLSALDQEIANSATKVTGDGKSFVPKISGYEDLIFQRQLVEREVSAADAALDSARIQADRQQLYLEEISKPDFPDYPVYPRSIADIAIVFVTMLGLYFIGSLLVAGAREHKSM
ncbi:capsule biosynthesis protein [Gluconobacter wancherniae]|uniref:Capsule polysaccharide export protein n=1 Tax=Gluconobacter wancherniae NBRC 103581 TaxID=656744 RepID=A0A511AZP4_9PROT|nr:capsule biosynthesis protein [Gluconobacter wancherniae]MBF0854493.1 capsule biosynthesis protein [Gluconobacter wancherniae]GBD57556.1 capsule polysaccharide export protein [Gluconobacter wancherniae NBRC 103581]GEK93670.1 capsule polysaccharide export protein [Gluconobacter wancherniae NBRC 103581]